MRIVQKISLAATFILLVLVSSACGGSIVQSSTNSGGNGSGGFHLASYIQDHVKNNKKLVIRLDYHNPSLAFAIPLRQGVAQAANELGVDAQLIGPASGSAADQVAELQTLINQQQVDALAVSSASNDALKPVIAQAYNAGIPIISFNTDNPGSKEMAFVGQDLKASGMVEGEQLLKVLNGKKGKVVVFSVDTGAGWSSDRYSGFQAAVKDAGLQIVGPVNTGDEPGQAYNVVQNTMSANSDAVAIVSLDCCSLTAAAKWVDQTKNTGKISVVGFDLLPQTATYIKSGVIQTVISQDPVRQGYEAVKALVNFLKNQQPLKTIDTGAKIITKDNLADTPVEG